MPAVSSMTTQLRVDMLRIYGAVILVLAISSLEIKEMVDYPINSSDGRVV